MSLDDFLPSFKELEDSDFDVLAAIERHIKDHKRVPEELVKKTSKLHPDEVSYRIRRLRGRRLIWRPSGSRPRYVLNYLGLDILALKMLVDADKVEALGRVLGVGKESDVYEGISPKEERLAVKFFRMGRTSFTRYSRAREYLAEEHSDLIASVKAGGMEWRALRKLFKAGVDVPRPVARKRHVVVTEAFVGVELASVVELEQPEDVLDSIINNVVKAYQAGVIHGDLSAHNVLVKPGLDVTLIDLPQWVTPSHPRAKELLERDVNNILSFFLRKWDVRRDPEQILQLMRASKKQA